MSDDKMRTITLRVILINIILFVLVLFSTCRRQPTQWDHLGVGIIVPGKSVDGIKLGDSLETVVTKLGKPTSVGWASGLYRGWRHISYIEGTRLEPYIRLQFLFIDEGDDYGPVDAILIGPVYKGKTKEGIRIGSTLEKVHQVYGLPAKSRITERSIIDKYCFNEKKFEIHYKDSLISGMSTGYFVPMPEDDTCK
jgi:hypothetical protein